MEEVVLWCGAALLVTRGDLFRIQGTRNQYGYHSILQRYATPSSLRLVGQSFVFQQDNDPTHLQVVWGIYDQGEWWRAASDDLASTITQPQPNWDGLGLVGPQSEGKAANKCSAYGRTPSRLLEKHSRWSWLRECQECAKLSSMEEILIENTFLVTAWFHVLFHSLSSQLFYNVENSKIKRKTLLKVRLKSTNISAWPH